RDRPADADELAVVDVGEALLVGVGQEKLDWLEPTRVGAGLLELLLVLLDLLRAHLGHGAALEPAHEAVQLLLLGLLVLRLERRSIAAHRLADVDIGVRGFGIRLLASRWQGGLRLGSLAMPLSLRLARSAGPAPP